MGTTLVYAGYIGGAGARCGIGDRRGHGRQCLCHRVHRFRPDHLPGQGGAGPRSSTVSLDAFVAKVKADGTGLLYAGYIGGAGLDIGTGVAVDALGNAYVAGATYLRPDELPGPRGAGPEPSTVRPTPSWPRSSPTAPACSTPATSEARASISRAASPWTPPAMSISLAKTSSDQTTFPVTVGPDLIFGGGAGRVRGEDIRETRSDRNRSDRAAHRGEARRHAHDVRHRQQRGSRDREGVHDALLLSTDTVRSANDILLIGTRVVSSLEPGASLGGSATVTLPTNVPLGSYRVLGCVDDTKVIAELDETNNCLAGQHRPGDAAQLRGDGHLEASIERAARPQLLRDGHRPEPG